MKQSKVINMTEGSPIKLLIQFAIPLLIGNLFQQAYNLADSVIVGRFLGSDALAAVGATGSLTFLFFSVCNGISSGAGIVTSQFFGGGQDEYTKRAIANSAYVMLVAALITGVAAYFAAEPLLIVMDTPQPVMPDALSYIRMSCIGVPLVAVYNYSAAMLRALGDSKTPLYFLICACFLNVVLDLLLVCVFGMGVFGAALATVIAQMLSGAGCLGYAIRYNPYFRLSRENLKPDFAVIYQDIRIGLPLALQWSLIAVSATILQRFVNTFGPDAMAANTAVGRVEQLIHMVYGSVSTALATYAGQNYGARNIQRVKLGLKQGMVLSVVISLTMLLLFSLLNEPIMHLFVKELPVIQIGAQGLRITSFFYLSLGGIYMSRAILNGVGDAMFAFVNGIVELACRLGVPIALVATFPGIDHVAIWWTTCLTWTIGAIFCMLRYWAWNRKTRSVGCDPLHKDE